MFYCIFIRFQQELNVILKYLGPQKVIKNWKKMSIADQYMLMIWFLKIALEANNEMSLLLQCTLIICLSLVCVFITVHYESYLK